jgi:hypothetical protein
MASLKGVDMADSEIPEGLLDTTMVDFRIDNLTVNS